MVTECFGKIFVPILNSHGDCLTLYGCDRYWLVNANNIRIKIPLMTVLFSMHNCEQVALAMKVYLSLYCVIYVGFALVRVQINNWTHQ